MTTITFLIEDGDYRRIEKHKWNTEDWERVEKTFSYLRKKYGKVINWNKQEEDTTNWVSD